MVLELLQYHGGAGVSKLHLIYHPEIPDTVRQAGRVPCALCQKCWVRLAGKLATAQCQLLNCSGALPQDVGRQQGPQQGPTQCVGPDDNGGRAAWALACDSEVRVV